MPVISQRGSPAGTLSVPAGTGPFRGDFSVHGDFEATATWRNL